MRCIRSNAPHRGKRGTAKVTSEVLKKGGEVTSEVWGKTCGFDFEDMRFGVKAWRASASNAREGGALSAPIVLVHGFAQQASTWDKVALSLSRAGVECFAFELAGHGKSASPDGWRCSGLRGVRPGLSGAGAPCFLRSRGACRGKAPRTGRLFHGRPRCASGGAPCCGRPAGRRPDRPHCAQKLRSLRSMWPIWPPGRGWGRSAGCDSECG